VNFDGNRRRVSIHSSAFSALHNGSLCVSELYNLPSKTGIAITGKAEGKLIFLLPFRGIPSQSRSILHSCSKQMLFSFLLVAIATVAIAGCQAPPSPTVRAFGDNKFWVTVEPMDYVIGSTNDRISVPKGFVTDFASIPQGLWSLGLSPHGQYSRAAVIHDYLYWSQGCTRGMRPANPS
jgi:hypothetical protein